MPGMAGIRWITFPSDYGWRPLRRGCHGGDGTGGPGARGVDVAAGGKESQGGGGGEEGRSAKAVNWRWRPGGGDWRGMVAASGGKVLVRAGQRAAGVGGRGAGRREAGVALENPAYRLEPVRDFHGRDVLDRRPPWWPRGGPGGAGAELGPAAMVRLSGRRRSTGNGPLQLVAGDHFGLPRPRPARQGMAGGRWRSRGGEVGPGTGPGCRARTFDRWRRARWSDEDSFGSLACRQQGPGRERIGAVAGERGDRRSRAGLMGRVMCHRAGRSTGRGWSPLARSRRSRVGRRRRAGPEEPFSGNASTWPSTCAARRWSGPSSRPGSTPACTSG